MSDDEAQPYTAAPQYHLGLLDITTFYIIAAIRGTDGHDSLTASRMHGMVGFFGFSVIWAMMLGSLM